jgi:predicted benzoate:H+ symporter BenE
LTLLSELIEGVPVLHENGNKVGMSKIAARDGIAKVVISRIGMATPILGEPFPT